jgi:hypothetical protein
MKSILKKNISLKSISILHNRVLLYFVFILSLGNLFYLLLERDITTIVIFLIVGFLTSFFSKNMMVILFVAVTLSNILKYGARIRHEGLENIADGEDDDDVEEFEGDEESGKPQTEEKIDLSDKYLEKDEKGKDSNKSKSSKSTSTKSSSDNKEKNMENYKSKSKSD